MLTVDIDVGGTLTDGLVRGPDTMVEVKVDTTPHDLTVCFFECLEEAADRLGYADLESFLGDVSVLRWSSTVTTNVLAERKGPRVGLIVTRGHERDLYGEGDSVLVGDLVAAEDIHGLPPGFTEEDVLAILRRLLEGGVRRICISLKGSFEDDGAERLVRRVIQEQYPDQYVGAVPVMLGSEGCRHPDDRTRTHYALLSAYVHDPLATTLFRAEDGLKDRFRYRGDLLIGNIDGGVTRIAKTKALETLEVGPVFGIYGAAYWARRYGLERVISLDVGGTTAKVGAVYQGRPVMVPETEILGVSLGWPSVFLRSISVGGGTVAGVAGSEVRLGPESMGAYPGPACYNLGGDRATVTDAFALIGLLNPDNFLGGRRTLEVEASRRVLRNDVGAPLGIETDEAAWRIKEKAEELVAEAMARALTDLQWRATEVTLFAFGGNGPLFAPGVAEKVGIRKVMVFNLGAVFSAFGSSISDVCHNYRRALFEQIRDMEKLAGIVEDMVGEARRDIRGEGLATDRINWAVEVDLLAEQGAVREEMLLEENSADVVARILSWLGEVVLGQPGVSMVRWLQIRALYPVAKYEPVEETVTGDTTGTIKPVGDRTVFWRQGPKAFGVYRWEELVPGIRLEGPAIVESARTTYLVPPAWVLEMDSFRNALLERVPESKS